tara:strand:+ start:1 stop:966 length:966 start_codon:yes stop_codon:yes gene_type:complete
MVRPGLINLDFADVKAVMDEMGKAMMGTGEASGENRAQEAAEKAIANPLLDEISLSGARGVLINVTGGNDMTLFELDEAANRIRDEIDGDAKILVGTTLDPTIEGLIRVSVVATGIEADNHIVENTNELGVTNKALVRENNRSNIESRPLNALSKNNLDSSRNDVNLTRSSVDTVKSDQDNNSIRSKDDQFSNNMDIPNIFKVRKSGENLSSLNVEKTNERLQAAVNKEPDPSLYNRPNELTKKLSNTSKSTLNSFLQKMTGFRVKKTDENTDKRIQPNLIDSNREVSASKEKDLTKSQNVITQEDNLKDDIPAFLRRQAN